MRRLLTTLAALALLMAACGDDDDAVEGTDTTAPAGQDADGSDTTVGDGLYGDGGGGAGAAEGSAVTVRDFSFQPEAIEVAAGDTVTWTNEDGVAHTVTAGSPGAAAEDFDEPLDAGGTAEVTFDESGTYDYFCEIHPTMTAQVVVSS